MSHVSLAKDLPLSREQIEGIASEIYDPGSRWYATFARELTEVRGSDTAISSAAVQQWMNGDNRRPPWWATALIYKLLVRKRAEMTLRAARIQSWIELLEKKNIKNAVIK